MSRMSDRASRANPVPIRTVFMYRNGDAFFAERRFVINPRQVPSFDSFLNVVTQGVEAPFGAVRNVYTPMEGHKVKSLEEMLHGDKYVAGGKERFKKLDYYHIKTKKPQPKKSEVIKPVVHSRIIVPARWRTIPHQSCTINVFTNGDILVPPIRIMIPRYSLRCWERVLAIITEKVRLRTGAVQRLCTLDGTPLSSSVELENHRYYVATGVERFRFLQYFHWVPRKENPHDHGSGIQSGLLPPEIRNGRHSKDWVCPRRDYELPLFQNFADHRVKPDSLCYPKPERTRHPKQVPKTTLAYSSGEGGMFRARGSRKEIAGAAEVQEDARTKVDLPIDQVEARVVAEELCTRPESPGQTSGSSRPESGGSKKVSFQTSPTPAAPQAETSNGRVTRTHTPETNPGAAGNDIQERKKLPTVPAASNPRKDDVSCSKRVQ